MAIHHTAGATIWVTRAHSNELACKKNFFYFIMVKSFMARSPRGESTISACGVNYPLIAVMLLKYPIAPTPWLQVTTASNGQWRQRPDPIDWSNRTADPTEPTRQPPWLYGHSGYMYSIIKVNCSKSPLTSSRTKTVHINSMHTQ